MTKLNFKRMACGLLCFTLIWALLRPRDLMRNPAFFAVLAVLGGSLLYALILLVTPWHLPMLFGTVIPGRLLVHLAPVVIFATISLLWRDQSEPVDEPSVS